MKCSSNSGFQLIKPLPTSTVLSFIQIISNDVKRIQFTLNRLIFNQRTNFNFSVERMLARVSLNLQSKIFSLPFPLLSDTRKFLIDIIKQDYNDYRKQSNLSIKNGKKPWTNCLIFPQYRKALGLWYLRIEKKKPATNVDIF